jgi:hypothetical protein
MKGIFSDREATEIAAGLNRHLQSTPRGGHESRLSPEALRQARPTDF